MLSNNLSYTTFFKGGLLFATIRDARISACFQADQTTATALFSLAQCEIIQLQKRLHIFKGEKEGGKREGETETECQGGHKHGRKGARPTEM